MPQPADLLHALDHGDLDTLSRLAADRPEVLRTFLRQPRPWGDEQWMPLHLAAATGQVEVVDWLLGQGVQPDCRTRFTTPLHARRTPLHLAAAAGHTAVAQRLIHAAAEVDVYDAHHASPLWLAARHGHADLIRLLTRRGADLESRDTQGRTPLHAALLPPLTTNQPPPTDQPPLTNQSPLTNQPPEAHVRRTWVPDPAPALALLDARADPNATCPKEPEGYTPLHRCAVLDPPPATIIARLLQAGADPTLTDPRHGRTPAQLAHHLGHPWPTNV